MPSLHTYTAPPIRIIAVPTGSRACFDMNSGLGSIALCHARSQSELHRAWTCAALAMSQEICDAKETYFRGGARGMDVAYGAICRNAVCGPLWRRRSRALSMINNRVLELHRSLCGWVYASWTILSCLVEVCWLGTAPGIVCRLPQTRYPAPRLF